MASRFVLTVDGVEYTGSIVTIANAEGSSLFSAADVEEGVEIRLAFDAPPGPGGGGPPAP